MDTPLSAVGCPLLGGSASASSPLKELHPGRCLRAAFRSIGRRHLFVRTSWLGTKTGNVMRRRGGRCGVGVFTGWSHSGLARLSTREGKNQWGWLAGKVAPRRLTKVWVGRKCGTAEAGGRVGDAQELCRRPRRSEPCLWSRSLSSWSRSGRERAESRVGESSVWERGGESGMDNCARAGRMQVQFSSIGWKRSLMAMLIVLWRRSCCFRPVSGLGGRKNCAVMVWCWW